MGEKGEEGRRPQSLNEGRLTGISIGFG